MKLTIDQRADALYLRLDDAPIVDSHEVAPGVLLDYNEDEKVVGVEVIGKIVAKSLNGATEVRCWCPGVRLPLLLGAFRW